MMNQRSSLMVLATLVAVATAQDCGDIRNCAQCLDAGCASSKKVCMTECSMARDGDSCYVATDYADMDSDAVCTIARDEEDAAMVESAIGDEATDDDAADDDATDDDATDDDAADEEASDLPEELVEVDEEEASFANTTAISGEAAAPGDFEEEEEEPKPDKNADKAEEDVEEDDEEEEAEESTGPGFTVSRAEGAEVVSGAVSVGQWVSLAVGAFAMVATAMSN